MEKWVDWSPDEFVENVTDLMVAVQSNGCGTAQRNVETLSKSTYPILEQGGGEWVEIKKRGRKKKPLPGVSANQKSVRDFFSVGSSVCSVRQTGVIPGQLDTLADSAEEYLLCELVLEKEYRLAMVKMLQLRWRCQNIYTTRIYTPKTCQRGGEEGENSKLKGGNRAICSISKRLVKKSGSVAEITNIFLQEGVGGSSKNQQQSKDALITDKSLNFRQKLSKFKP